MHPPLDRPHPDCQQAVEDLRDCHETRSIFNISACNQLKYQLDACFKEEKSKYLKVLNKDMHEKRQREEEAWADAAGHKMSFEDYLKNDKKYQSELKIAEQRKGQPSQYQQRSTGGHD
jgi:COX assembly protein 2